MTSKRAMERDATPQDEPMVAGESVEDEDPFAIIDRMRAAFADVPPDEVEAETARILAEVRAEMAAERQVGVG